jgi:hypothetical protein
MLIKKQKNLKTGITVAKKLKKILITITKIPKKIKVFNPINQQIKIITIKNK